jgi:hypothetical protein
MMRSPGTRLTLSLAISVALAAAAGAAIHTPPVASASLAAQAAVATSQPASQPDWVAAVRAVHARFTGQAGTVGQFGDSITYSKAFFSALFWGDYKGEPNLAEFRKAVPQKCANWKGIEHANMGGWTVEQVAEAIDTALKNDNPEIAFLMVGTNDLSRQADPARKDFKTKLDHLVKAILANGTVLVLHTVPPRHGKMDAVEAYNKVIREVAGENHVPLIDYCAEVLARRPTDWDGSLISGDGVHPSFPDACKADFTDDGLKNSGYTLRNCLAVKMWYQIRATLAAATVSPDAGK